MEKETIKNNDKDEFMEFLTSVLDKVGNNIVDKALDNLETSELLNNLKTLKTLKESIEQILEQKDKFKPSDFNSFVSAFGILASGLNSTMLSFATQDLKQRLNKKDGDSNE